MSGRRQHYLPRFLQNGFLYSDGRFWVHRKGKQPFPTTPSNIGLEVNFYGEADAGSLDEAITEAEREQSKCLDVLRECDKDQTVQHDAISTFVTSLSVRSRWLREEFGNKSDRLLEHLAAGLTRHLSPLASPELKDLLVANITQMREAIQATAKEAHNDTLADSIAPPLRVDECRRLRWTVLVRPRGTFILSDVGVVFRVAENRYKALPDNGDPLLAVALPIAHTHLLLGQPSFSSGIPDPREVNEASARCSFEFLIACRNTDVSRKLQEEIGKWSDIISQDEIESIAETCFREAFGKVS